MRNMTTKTLLLSACIGAVSTLQVSALTTNGSGAYQISDASELEEFASLVNSGNCAIDGILVADIDMENVAHTPIGTTENPYRGKFDGGYHRILNLVMENPDGTNLALFGVAAVGAGFSNFVIDSSCTFFGADKCASVVGQSRDAVEGTIDFSCIGNEATIICYGDPNGNHRAAGIAGPANDNVYYRFVNCYNTGDVQGSAVGAMTCRVLKAQLNSCWTTYTVKRATSEEVKAKDPDPISTYMTGNALEESLGDWSWNFFFRNSDSEAATSTIYNAIPNPALSKNSKTWKDPFALSDFDGYFTTLIKLNPIPWEATGRMCWYLNNMKADENCVWGQNLDEGDRPTFMPGAKVVFKDAADWIFYNTEVTNAATRQMSGIETVTVTEAAKRAGTYNLQGIKIDNVTSPGLYIIDGKKVLVK